MIKVEITVTQTFKTIFIFFNFVIYIINKKHSAQCMLGKQHKAGVSSKYILFSNQVVNPVTSISGLITVVGYKTNIIKEISIVAIKDNVYL